MSGRERYTGAMSPLLIAALLALWAAPALAYTVGERRLQATEPAAALRDSQHRTELRITVWYPASPAAVEQDVTIGPPDRALFYVGEAAADAAFADEKRRPVILLSHGFGGT